MTNTATYQPEATDQTKRLAALHGAKRFGTEAIHLTGIVSDDGQTVAVHEVVGCHPKWHEVNVLGDAIVVHVSADGTVTERDD